MESLGFSILNIMSSANSNSFTSSFSIWMLFFPPCLNALSYNAILTKSSENKHHCLGRDLKEKTFMISSLSMMLPVSMSYMAFIRLRCILFIPTCWEFFLNHKCIYWDNHVILIIIFVNVIYHITDLWMLNHPYILGINPTWSGYMILLMNS